MSASPPLANQPSRYDHWMPWPGLPPTWSGTEQTDLFRLWGYNEGTRGILRDLMTALRDIDADADLTAAGKAKKVETAARLAVSRLDGRDGGTNASLRNLLALGARIDALAGEVDRQLGIMPADTVAYLRLQEVRGHLLSMGERDRLAVLAKAMHDGEREVLTAALGAPSFVRLAADDAALRDKLRAALGKVRSPEKMGEIELLRAAYAAVTANRATAEKCIRKEAQQFAQRHNVAITLDN